MAVDVTRITTDQEIFDLVAGWLLTMPHRALTENKACAYRGEGGLPCAVGILLTDEECIIPEDRREDHEGGTTLDDANDSDVISLAASELLPARLMTHVDLLESLQSAHDCSIYWTHTFHGPADRKTMIPRLRAIAEHFKIESFVLDLLTETGDSS